MEREDLNDLSNILLEEITDHNTDLQLIENDITNYTRDINILVTAIKSVSINNLPITSIDYQ